jgi:serine protease Do
MLMDALLTLAVAGGNTDVAVVDMAWETPSNKEMKKLKVGDARRVMAIDPGTPGDKAGIHSGDILTAMEGVPYHQNIYGEMAAKCLKAHPEGCTVHIDALRDGAPIKFEVEIKPAFTQEAAQRLLINAAALAARPVASPQAAAPAEAPPASIKLGIRAHNASDEDAHAAKLPETYGVLVESVDKGGLAESMKIQAGDIIVELNGARVSGMQEFKQKLQSGAVTTITVWRAGAAIKLAVPESL